MAGPQAWISGHDVGDARARSRGVPHIRLTIVKMETSRTAMERSHDAWRRVEAWLDVHAPTIRGGLRPGARERELDDLERHLGRTLPPEFRAVYLVHDGENSSWGSVIPFFEEFLPLAGVLRWSGYALTPEERAELNQIVEIEEPGVIRQVALSDACIPFARDGAGNYLAVDLEPGPQGTLGQVVDSGRDDLTQPRRCYAPELIAWFERLADRMESGEIEVECQTDVDGTALESLEDWSD